MPEALKFVDVPVVLVENHVELYREGYIPGSKILSREWSSDGYDVFFQIPTSIAHLMDEHELQGLKGQARGWWRDRAKKLEPTNNGRV
jgi:hypothetical protein